MFAERWAMGARGSKLPRKNPSDRRVVGDSAHRQTGIRAPPAATPLRQTRRRGRGPRCRSLNVSFRGRSRRFRECHKSLMLAPWYLSNDSQRAGNSTNVCHRRNCNPNLPEGIYIAGGAKLLFGVPTHRVCDRLVGIKKWLTRCPPSRTPRRFAARLGYSPDSLPAPSRG